MAFKVSKLVSRSVITALLAFTVTGTGSAWAAESCEVEYLGEANEIVTAEGDVFDHVGRLVPGDECTGEVRLKNSGEVRVKLWCWAEDTVAGSEELLSALQLRIADGDKVVYEGAVHPSGWNEPILLGEYAPGEAVTLDWTMHMPIEVGNELASNEARIDWTFGVEQVDGFGGDVAQPPSKDDLNGGGFAGADTNKPWYDRLAQTGDAMGMLIIGTLGMAVVAGIVAVGMGRRRQHEDEKEQ